MKPSLASDASAYADRPSHLVSRGTFHANQPTLVFFHGGAGVKVEPNARWKADEGNDLARCVLVPTLFCALQLEFAPVPLAQGHEASREGGDQRHAWL
jgi:hypothetical protein